MVAFGTIKSDENAVRVLDRVGESDIVNDNTEQTIYSFEVPANAMGTIGCVRLSMFGDYVNNSGVGATFTFKVKFGGTIIYQDDSKSRADSANRVPWWMHLMLANKSSASVQVLSAMTIVCQQNSPNVGRGAFPNDENDTVTSCMTDTEGASDTTSAQTLDITIQHSAAHASLSFRRKYAVLELL